jgi:hypothetical protein
MPGQRALPLFVWLISHQPVVLSKQTSHQQSVNSTFLSQQISTSHHPPTKRRPVNVIDQ